MLTVYRVDADTEAMLTVYRDDAATEAMLTVYRVDADTEACSRSKETMPEKHFSNLLLLSA